MHTGEVTPSGTSTATRGRKFLRLLGEELVGMDLRAAIGRVLVAPLPRGAGSRSRARLLRLVGHSIGDRTLLMSSFMLIGGRGAAERLSIGAEPESDP